MQNELIWIDQEALETANTIEQLTVTPPSNHLYQEYLNPIFAFQQAPVAVPLLIVFYLYASILVIKFAVRNYGTEEVKERLNKVSGACLGKCFRVKNLSREDTIENL